jgi:hypothetical protein
MLTLVEISKKEFVGILHLHSFHLKVGGGAQSHIRTLSSQMPSVEEVTRHIHCFTINLSGRARFIDNTFGGV